jgi:hypothetical protein
MICIKCNLDKDLTEFSWKHKIKQIKVTICKICQRLKSKNHYIANKQTYFQRNEEYVKNTRQKLNEYKTNKGCFDCAEKDFRCLDFDHLDQKTKYKSISKLSQQWSYERILIEIEKCVVRCANCHRKRTSNQFHWYQ